MASCPKEHPSLSARAHTSRNLSEYFRVSSSADLSFHAYSYVAKTIVSALRNKCIVYELYLRIIMTFFVKLFNMIKTTRVMTLRFVQECRLMILINLNLEINIDRICLTLMIVFVNILFIYERIVSINTRVPLCTKIEFHPPSN